MKHYVLEHYRSSSDVDARPFTMLPAPNFMEVKRLVGIHGGTQWVYSMAKVRPLTVRFTALLFYPSYQATKNRYRKSEYIRKALTLSNSLRTKKK